MEHTQRTVGICKPTEYKGVLYATRVSATWAKFLSHLGYNFTYDSSVDGFTVKGVSGTQFYVFRSRQKAKDSALLTRRADYQKQLIGLPYICTPKNPICPRCGLIGADYGCDPSNGFDCPLCAHDTSGNASFLIASCVLNESCIVFLYDDDAHVDYLRTIIAANRYARGERTDLQQAKQRKLELRNGKKKQR